MTLLLSKSFSIMLRVIGFCERYVDPSMKPEPSCFSLFFVFRLFLITGIVTYDSTVYSVFLSVTL